MLNPLEVFIAVLLALAVYLVFSNQRAREQVNAIAGRFCQRHGLQFLDGTVALASFGLARYRGRIVVRRSFRFDYSLNGVDRFRGELVLVGRDMETLVVNPDHMKLVEPRPSPGSRIALEADNAGK